MTWLSKYVKGKIRVDKIDKLKENKNQLIWSSKYGISNVMMVQYIYAATGTRGSELGNAYKIKKKLQTTCFRK